MIKKLLLTPFALLFLANTIHAQKDIECQTKLSNFHEDVKAKKYNKAYDDWLYVKTNCPAISLAIYTDGEKILKHKIKKATGEEKISFVKDLNILWVDRMQYYKSRTPKGEYACKACQLAYDNKKDLSKTEEELFNCFDEAFKIDKKTFTHPKSLYTYFSLAVDLFDKGKKSTAELFNIYDNINEKIELEIQNYSEKLNALIAKQEGGEKLNKKEINIKKVCKSYLKNYTKIQESITAKLSINTNCKNLIPLYSRGFSAHQNDAIWLKRAVSRMYHKKCTEDELYEKLVKQYDMVAPSADTKIFVATLLLKKGKDEEAYNYLEDAYKLETRAYKKANLAIRIGVILKKKKLYTKARQFLLDALKLNLSNGKPHLIIAKMYHDSAKNCGKDNFYKRAVFWLAAKEARKASRIDPTLQKQVHKTVANYLAKVPTREEIFQKDMAGKTIDIKCWINRSIVVPRLD